MEILIEGKKAKWVDGEKNGRWQNIKTDDKGAAFIRKGVDVIYINDISTISNEVSKCDEEVVTNEKDDHELKIYYAYFNTKPVWDKMFDDISDTDYYYYRGLCTGMSKSFFTKVKTS